MEYTNSMVRLLIDDLIHSERDRRLMARRLIDGVTIERLSEEFDLSVSQTKRIINKNFRIIERHIPGEPKMN